MKKYISLLMSGLMAVVLLTGCDKDTEGQTWITYYPDFTLDGSLRMTWDAGKPFVDPGYTCTLDGVDITDQVTISTSMDLTDPQPGYYTINYSAVNADGISSSTSRNVLVYAAGDNVSGYYTSSTDCYRSYGSTIYYGGFPVVIYGVGPDMYYISDFFGGWYQYRMNYGAAYAATGIFSIDGDNKLILEDSLVPAWGDSVDEIEGSYDPDTCTFEYDALYAGSMTFHVILNKN